MEIEEIFTRLFSKYPESFNKNKIDHFCMDTNDETKFEILLNIYMLAMTRCLSLIDILENKSEKEDILHCEEIMEVNLIDENILDIPSKWFYSCGYKLNINELNKEILNYDSSEYYCRILLREAAKDYFIKNEITTQYFFLLNSKYKEGCEINKIKSIVINPVNNKYYSINFTKLI